MGHERIETTLRNAHLDDSDMKDALQMLLQQRKVRSTIVEFPKKKGA
jgi:hypothetical protein